MDTKLANLKSLFKASIQTNGTTNSTSNSNSNCKGSLGFQRSDYQWTNSESFGPAQEFHDFVEGKKRNDHGDTFNANGDNLALVRKLHTHGKSFNFLL